MNKQYFISMLLINCSICEAQNLVPNPGFEIYNTCPTSFGELSNAVPWYQPTTGTSDYFDSCNTAFNSNGVPANYLGFQNARHGSGYAGFFTYYWGIPQWNYKEYIEVQLTNPLIAGVTYYVNFYVSLSDSCNYATDDIGAYFSNTSVTSSNFFPLPYTPQITNLSNNIISDKLNWTMISGTFTAAGGEDYLIIGNFLDDNNTDTVYTGGGTLVNSDYVSSYYYIDDIYVSSDSMYCIVPVGIEES